MEIDKLYKISNTFFSILFLLILLDSFDHNLGFFLNKQFPNIYFFTFGEVTEGWKKEIWMENGLVEIMQELLLFFTICYLLYFLNKFKNKTENFIKIFLILEILGLSYFLLEEISWGQHIINYNTPNLGFIDHKVLHLETGYNFKMFFTIVLSFNFFRLSELHEFIFAYYFLWHSFFLKEKIIKK